MIVYSLRCKSEHWLLSRIGADYWTTLGSTIWYPEWARVRGPECHPDLIEHELIHVRQQQGWPLWLWLLLYCIFPVPFFFAWFRWRAEREAYLVNIRQHGYDVGKVVDALWRYGWPWPKAWMREWFEEQVRDG